MASLNTSHHQDGGVLLYSGELVLLYCDKVNCDIDGVGYSNGRIFLTTHRIVFTSQPINQNPRLMSLAAPFYAMFDLGLEQPVFGANYIRGKVRTNSSQNTSPLTQNQYSFKLKFNKGGACEFGMALTQAAKQASNIARQSGFSDTFSFNTAPASQYYQAPSDIYRPNYPVGFTLPSQQFNETPQGTIYYQSAPPPYPGLVNAHQMNQQASPYAQAYPVANPTMNNSFGGGSVYETNRSAPQAGFINFSPYSANPVNPNQYPSVPQQQYTGNAYMPGNVQLPQQPPAYNQYPTQQQQQNFYQPTNNNPYQQQYPTPPQAGYMPQSNNTYPNLPNYNNGLPKKGN